MPGEAGVELDERGRLPGRLGQEPVRAQLGEVRAVVLADAEELFSASGTGGW